MSHQDKDRRLVRYNAEQLKLALHWLLGPVTGSSIEFREDCTWLPLQLAATALLWAWSDELTLGERFLAARRIAEHLYQPQQEFAGAPGVFEAARALDGRGWSGCSRRAFRQRMQAALAAQWRLHGWIVFGVDGSRVDLPRTSRMKPPTAPVAKRAGKKKRIGGRSPATPPTRRRPARRSCG